MFFLVSGKCGKRYRKIIYVHVWWYMIVSPKHPPREHSHETGQAKILQKDRLPGSNSGWTTKKSISVHEHKGQNPANPNQSTVDEVKNEWNNTVCTLFQSSQLLAQVLLHRSTKKRHGGPFAARTGSPSLHHRGLPMAAGLLAELHRPWQKDSLEFMFLDFLGSLPLVNRQIWHPKWKQITLKRLDNSPRKVPRVRTYLCLRPALLGREKCECFDKNFQGIPLKKRWERVRTPS